MFLVLTGIGLQQQHQKLYLHDHKGITVLQKLLLVPEESDSPYVIYNLVNHVITNNSQGRILHNLNFSDAVM